MKKKSLFITVLLVLLLAIQPVWANGALSEVRFLLEEGYVDAVPEFVLQGQTIEQILQRLGDPHTTYFTREQFLRFVESMDEQSFTGIGIMIDVAVDGVVVVAVLPDSPAAELGLLVGDIIYNVDGISLAGKTVEEAVMMLRGPEGTMVRIALRRGNQILDFSVVRRSLTTPAVSGKLLNGHIGYLALTLFTLDAALELGSIAEKLRAQGADSWILDLRGNSGGYLYTALEIVGYFIGERKAIQLTNRKDLAELNAISYGLLEGEVHVLVDGYSASASEIVASAIKDYARGTIVGSRTYGKGTVQEFFGLSDGGVLKMTTHQFFSLAGLPVNKIGVEPDIFLQDTDPQLVADLLVDNKFVPRVSGIDRIRTAVEVARKGWPSGSETVVLARADHFADALSGSVLAAKLGAPMLLTRSDRHSIDVEEELLRLKAKHVIILGGTNAISDTVLSQLALDYSVRRIAGADRYETAAKIAMELGYTTEAVLVNGQGFADALAAAVFAAKIQAPILLTRQNELPAPTLKALKELGTKELTVVGGEAVVSPAVLQALPFSADRLAGDDRYGTAVEVARAMAVDKFFMARGDDFADALAAGAWAAKEGGAVLLVRPQQLPPGVGEFLTEGEPAAVYLLGGFKAVSADVQAQLYRLLQ